MTRIRRLDAETPAQFKQRQELHASLSRRGYVRERCQFDRGERWFRYVNHGSGEAVILGSFMFRGGTSFTDWAIED